MQAEREFAEWWWCLYWAAGTAHVKAALHGWILCPRWNQVSCLENRPKTQSLHHDGERTQSTIKPFASDDSSDLLFPFPVAKARTLASATQTVSLFSFTMILFFFSGKPHNPMINAGAIVTTSLLKPKLQMADRFDYVSNCNILKKKKILLDS